MIAKKTQATLWALGCIGILGVGALALGNDTTKSLTINSPFNESEIYINDTAYISQNGTVRTQVPEGKHVVIVNYPDFWPWTKVIEVNNKATVLDAFLTPKVATGDDIENTDPLYLETIEKVLRVPLPTKEEKLTSTDGTITVWAEGGNIFAESNEEEIPEWFCDSALTCERQKQVMALEGTEVNGLQFYKRRNDVLLFSRPGAIYAVDIETRGVQNLQQIYVGGPAIHFLPDEEQKLLYVYDNGSLMQILF